MDEESKKKFWKRKVKSIDDNLINNITYKDVQSEQ